VDVDLLIETHPRLYHMAEAGSWSSIQQHGLLSTTALLDLFEVSRVEREAIESARRAETLVIEHPLHGRAAIRDQKPLIESRLERCLVDMTPRVWYELLNGYVFFWLTSERLHKLVNARPYRQKEHDVLTLDSVELLRRHQDSVLLAPYNTGTTAYEPPKRGRRTFLPIDAFPYDAWRKKRNDRLDAVVELVIPYAVPDVTDFVLKVERQRGDEVLQTVWTRPKTRS
jgi:hypothetical protein